MVEDMRDEATNIISNINNAQDSEMLMKGLEQISNYVDKQTPDVIESGNYQLATELYEMVASAYDKAAKMIEHDLKFSDLKNCAELFLSNRDYWHRKTESAKNETVERLNNAGNKLQNQGQYIESTQYFNKVLDIEPDDSKSWLDKGNSFYYLKKFNDAITCYDRVIEIDQNNPYAYCNKGHAYLQLEMYEKSKKSYETALALNDKFVDAMIGLSSVYYRGFFDNAKAVEYTKNSLKIDSDRINAKANLAEFLLEYDDYEEREELVNEVLKDKPDEYGYPMRLVKVCSLYFRNETDKAIAAAFDLLEYYKSIHNRQILNWDFRGLKHMIEKKKISNQIKEILYSFISLAETSDESTKIDILENLPEKIRSKGVIRMLFNTNEVSNVFKKKSRQDIMVKNESEPDPNKPGWYRWKIYLTPQESLDKVKSVTYTLHETFPVPVRSVTDHESGFKLESNGWGEFQVKVEIHFNDGKKRTKYHWLELGPTPLDKDD